MSSHLMLRHIEREIGEIQHVCSVRTAGVGASSFLFESQQHRPGRRSSMFVLESLQGVFTSDLKCPLVLHNDYNFTEKYDQQLSEFDCKVYLSKVYVLKVYF